MPRMDHKEELTDYQKALKLTDAVIACLPPPHQLVQKVEKEKITILLDKQVVDFFRKAAKQHNVGYQAMINNLLNNYIKRNR